MPLPSFEEISLLHSTICHAVGDPRRIQILYALKESPQNVTTLSKLLDVPQPTLSRHLALLRERALVIATRDGASVVYSLANPILIDVLDTMRDILRQSLNHHQDKLNTDPTTGGIYEKL